jgi:hypothetical protein
VDSVEYELRTKNVIRRREYDNSKPKRISLTRTRPGGDFDCEPFLPVSVSEETHLGTDLLVGDVVSLSVGVTREGEEWAMQLTIERRPFGRIPPIHGDPHLGMPQAIHLRYQAWQDWEEKGTPIPKMLLDRDGRAPWTNPPYPPVAPMPREAKPGTPGKP